MRFQIRPIRKGDRNVGASIEQAIEGHRRYNVSVARTTGDAYA